MMKMKLMEHAEKEQKMERLNTVLRHPLYQQYYKELREEERDRIFCCHQMEHLLDVARIAYIRNLENNLGYSKELLYTTAILHDIGKALQYKEKIPHEIAGAQIAEKILDSLPEAVAYTEEEKKEILTAIRGHRREWKDFYTKVINVPEIALPAQRKKNVTGVKKRKTGRYRYDHREKRV